MMTRNGLIAIAGVAALVAGACARPAPTAPPTAAQPVTELSAAHIGESCTVDVGTTDRPLPALHELEGWLNDALEATDPAVNCGIVRSLDSMMEALTKALDQVPPNHDAACGISGALANQLASLVRRDVLETPSFPPPFPGGPNNVLLAAQALNERWCAAARGELAPPQ